MIETVALKHVPAQPWRNGGGSTHGLLAWPGPAHWQWRISVAEITCDGPFSHFAGVRRWFAVLQGAGVMLRFAAHREKITPASPPLQFGGADAPGCELLDGPTLDLNMMLRDDAGRGSLVLADPGEEWVSPAPHRALFTLGAGRLQIGDTDAARLDTLCLAHGHGAQHQRWRWLPDDDGVARAWWLSFQPHAS